MGPRGDTVHRGGGRGNFDGDLSATLTTKLGIDEAKVTEALAEIRADRNADQRRA